VKNCTFIRKNSIEEDIVIFFTKSSLSYVCIFVKKSINYKQEDDTEILTNSSLNIEHFS